ncbi:tol-pal system protein YbgF [gut metagenome]|uniref:Tol-pal system protein YbgF n=1 Tax=gut metagenome TaxID=749906 RepID=J9H5H3_9ZZZZ
MVAVLAATSSGAWAFADDEARTAILDLREQVKALQAAQLQFVSRIEELQNQNRMLTGRVEELSNQIHQEGRASRDLFKDLDHRLGKFEPVTVVINGQNVEVEPQEKGGL